MKEEKSTDPDYDAISRCLNGEDEAFGEILSKYQKRAFNMTYQMVGDYNEAVEVVQDAFISVYKNIRQFKGKSKFSTWFYTIVMNTSRNRLKQMKTRASREKYSIDDPIETDEGQIAIEPASTNPSALERLESHEVQKGVQRCINMLEDEFREAIMLRDIQGFSYDEIRDTLNIAIGTVRSRIHRARLSIKDCMKKLIGEL